MQSPNKSTQAQAQETSSASAWLLLSLTSLCWGANAIFARLAVDEISPMALVALRWLLVLAIVAVIAWKPLRHDWPLLKPHLGRIALLGAFGYTVFNALFYVAAHHTTAVNLGVIQAVMPIFIFSIAFLRFRTPISFVQSIGVALAVGGVVLVAAQGSWQQLISLEFNRGDVILLVACLLYAIYTVALRARPSVSPLSFFAVMSVAAFLTSVPLALYEWAAADLLWPTPTGWMLVVAIAIFPSLLGQLLFMRGVEIIGPARAGVFVNLTPVIAAGLAVLLLGESFHWYHGAALAMVFGGIGLSERAG